MYKGNSQVELRRPQKSKFDLSHQKRLSTRMGRLTPVLVQEAIPGDKFNGSSEILLRLAPLLAPIYDDITLYVHFFFVPNRLLWSEWEEFITGGRLGVGVDPATAPIPPYIDMEQYKDSGFDNESGLGDYLGVPTEWAGVAGDYAGLTLDIMPFLAYQRCWYDYYRDRNYIADDIISFPYGSADQTSVALADDVMVIKTRDYLKDYFTAALPFTQRGVEVLMPLAGTGSVTYLPQSEIVRTTGAGAPDTTNLDLLGSGALASDGAPVAGNARIENIDEVELTASSVSINDFRSAYALQVWLERNAVGGSRYVESIQAHFAVKPQDSRLQRAEFLGGGRIMVRISEVVNTAFSENADSDVIPAGNLAGHGVTYGNTNSFRYFAPEHGFIIGVMSIMNKPSYYQGLSKMFRRKTFLDYPWPSFAKLGEQQVDKAEIFFSAANVTEDSDGNLPLFGYQSRYADWKQVQSSNHGSFRTDMMFWTLVRDFSSTPVLGEGFVQFSDTSQDRIFAVAAGDNFWCYISNRLSVVRALPYFGTPSII